MIFDAKVNSVLEAMTQVDENFTHQLVELVTSSDPEIGFDEGKREKGKVFEFKSEDCAVSLKRTHDQFRYGAVNVNEEKNVVNAFKLGINFLDSAKLKRLLPADGEDDGYSVCRLAYERNGKLWLEYNFRIEKVTDNSYRLVLVKKVASDVKEENAILGYSNDTAKVYSKVEKVGEDPKYTFYDNKENDEMTEVVKTKYLTYKELNGKLNPSIFKR